MLDEQEINKKLAEWAGFKDLKDKESGVCPVPQYELSDGHREYTIPNFTQSLDACFKWLVPKLRYPHIKLETWSGQWECVLYLVAAGDFEGKEETPALALCLAIEKLIDSQERKKGGKKWNWIKPLNYSTKSYLT